MAVGNHDKYDDEGDWSQDKTLRLARNKLCTPSNIPSEIAPRYMRWCNWSGGIGYLHLMWPMPFRGYTFCDNPRVIGRSICERYF